MKLNNELIKRLANGEIAYQHTGTDDQGYNILGTAFPKSYNLNWKKEYLDELRCSFYRRSPHSPNRCVGRTYIKEIESFTTEQFFEPERDRNDHSISLDECIDRGRIETPQERGERILSEIYEQETRKKQPTEARELAKQLFVAYMAQHNQTAKQAARAAIGDAKQFIKLLDENGL